MRKETMTQVTAFGVDPVDTVTVEKQVVLELDGKSIQHRFLAFHQAHPEVYTYFKKFAFEVIDAGEKIGAKAVMERVRWEVKVIKRAKGEFKINNTYISRYARMFTEHYPGNAKFFETRRLLRD